MKLAMKKTYINPNMLVVRLAMTQPLATSDPKVGLDASADAVLGSSLDAKGVSDVNVWDEEW
jgi:hypothetical protein